MRLCCYFALYTDGAVPRVTPSDGPLVVALHEIPKLDAPITQAEFFGPHTALITRERPKRGFLLVFTTDTMHAEPFFAHVRARLVAAVEGCKGYGIDVLRLWPFPLAEASEAVPHDLLAEDVFSVGFVDMAEHGYRAETFGLTKLGTREISFQFKGSELVEEAALMCGHLADWILEHERLVDHGQAMAFGFETIVFVNPAVQSKKSLRAWHPRFVQEVLPESIFPGVGVLQVLADPAHSAESREDLSRVLHVSMDQRLLLEELDLTGDAPHRSMTAVLKGALDPFACDVAHREEPTSPKDSGWRFRNSMQTEAAGSMSTVMLEQIAERAPALVRYLPLPTGIRLEWSAEHEMRVDTSRVQRDDVLDEGASDAD